MKLSIIIVNYNTANITLDCLRSIEKYPFSHSFEVILVDNNSQDGSKEIFSKFKTKKFKFKYIYRNNNLGFSKANNIGIKNSQGEFVLLLNSDTEVIKNSLDMFLSQAQKLNNAGVVGCKLLNSDKSIQESVFNLPSVGRSISQYIFKSNEDLNKYYPKTNLPKEVESVVGAAFLITPQALKKLGGLDEKYFMYFEDLDYCRKARASGFKVYYLPEVKIIHHHGASKGDWKKMINSSKLYHGALVHYIIFLITWFGQKLRRIGL